MPIIGQRAPLPVIPASEPDKPAEAEIVEAAATPAVAAQEEQLSPKFAALARKEKDLRRIQQEIKAQQEALKAERAKYESDYIPKSRIAENPLEVLTSQGLTHDQIAQMLLNPPGPQDQAVRKMQSELNALKLAQEESTKKAQENQTKEYEQALNQIRRDAESLINSDEQYETIKARGATEVVVELIKQTFDTDGTLLSIEDAAKQVEEHLFEEAVKIAGLKKVQSKLAPPVPVESPKPTLQEKLKNQPIKTLTNAQTATSSRPYTAAERRERAILAMKGQLQN